MSSLIEDQGKWIHAMTQVEDGGRCIRTWFVNEYQLEFLNTFLGEPDLVQYADSSVIEQSENLADRTIQVWKEEND